MKLKLISVSLLAVFVATSLVLTGCKKPNTSAVEESATEAIEAVQDTAAEATEAVEGAAEHATEAVESAADHAEHHMDAEDHHVEGDAHEAAH